VGRQIKKLKNAKNTFESNTSLLVVLDYKQVVFATNKRLVAVLATPFGRTVLFDFRVLQAGETLY